MSDHGKAHATAAPVPPRQPRYRHSGTASRLRSRALRRARRVIVALCGAALAVAVGTGVHSAARARSTTAVQAAFVAASTAKVLAAAAYYHQVESGAASLDDRLGAYDSGFQLREMIQQSDNDSWSLVMDAVGHAGLRDYAGSLGVSYAPESNTLTAADMAGILAKLYSGSLLDSEHAAQPLSYMQGTNYEALIPAAVPDGIEVFHKYGLLDDELHDAAILAQDGRAYALVIYTKGASLADVPERTEVIRQLTTAVANASF
ncbi:serine hydrolase [Arthrobacter sp. UYCu712]|uniref:serine hydrolase n=1 Tax=Arthrobacter sp. UYCu712 TaxID=3156340 RepID=UPI003394D537